VLTGEPVEGNQIRQIVYGWDGNQYNPEQTVLNNQRLESSRSGSFASEGATPKI
jgi:hypothetical protein